MIEIVSGPCIGEIKIGNGTYQVIQCLDPQPRSHCKVVYWLKGPNKYYQLFRHTTPRKHVLFAVEQPRGHVTDLYFTDRHGTVEMMKEH